MQRWIAGSVALGAGVAWLLIDRILLSVYPLSWGGPNIGGGALSVLAQLAAVSGVAMLISDPAGPAQRTSPQIIPAPYGHAPREPGQRARVVTLLIDGTLIVALIVVCFATPRDARNAGITGAVGLTLSTAGTPVLVLQVCRGSVDRVSIVGPNRGKTPNETIAELASRTAEWPPRASVVSHGTE